MKKSHTLRSMLIWTGVVIGFTSFVVAVAVPKASELSNQPRLPRVTCDEALERIRAASMSPFVLRAETVGSDEAGGRRVVARCGDTTVPLMGSLELLAPGALQISGTSSLHVQLNDRGELTILRTCLGCDSFPEEHSPWTVSVVHGFGALFGALAALLLVISWVTRPRRWARRESQIAAKLEARSIIELESERMYRDQSELRQQVEVLSPRRAGLLVWSAFALATTLAVAGAVFTHIDHDWGRTIGIAALLSAVTLTSRLPAKMLVSERATLSWTRTTPSLLTLPTGAVVEIAGVDFEDLSPEGYRLLVETTDGRRCLIEEAPPRSALGEQRLEDSPATPLRRSAEVIADRLGALASGVDTARQKDSMEA